MDLQKCLNCESKSVIIVKKGSFEILHCNNCTFEYVLNSKKILGENWFDNYSNRREKITLKG